MNAGNTARICVNPRSSMGHFQLIGIVTVADPAFPGGKRFCLAIRNAFASPPDAWVTLPDSSYVTVTTTRFAPGLAASVAGVDAPLLGFSRALASRACLSFSRWRRAARAAGSSAGASGSGVAVCGSAAVGG